MEDFNIEDLKRKVSTKPKRSLGSNVVTHKLIKIKNGYAYKPTLLLIFVYTLLFLIGSAFVGYAMFKIVTTNSFSVLKESYLMTGLATLFFVIGLYIIYFLFFPIKFDKSISRFYRSFNVNHKKKNAHLKDIIAIQILGEQISNGEANDYMSYEVNLVLKDASRINLVDYSDLKIITKDTNILGEFLEVPIWKM